MDRKDLPEPVNIPFFFNNPKPLCFTERIYRFTASICLVLFIIISGLFLNLAQIITMPLILISRSLVIRLHSQFAGFLWSLFQIMFERYQKANFTWSGGISKIPKKENAIVISNHCSFADFLMVHSIAYPKNMLPYCKYFVKVSSNRIIL